MRVCVYHETELRRLVLEQLRPQEQQVLQWADRVVVLDQTRYRTGVRKSIESTESTLYRLSLDSDPSRTKSRDPLADA